MRTSLLVRAVFALLVLATVGAFFVTQRLKRSTPFVQRVYFHQYVSPNGDGRKDTVRLRFDLPDGARVAAALVDARGDAVRRLVDGRVLRRGTHAFVWDGLTDGGRRAPDGVYRLRVTSLSEGRSVTIPRELTLDTTPPRPQLVAVTPPRIAPGRADRRGRVRIRFRGYADPAPVFTIFRTDGERARQVARFTGTRFRQSAEWHGRVRGRPAPAGDYAVSVTVRDRAGNAGSAPASLPPSRDAAAPGTGVAVSYLEAAGPSTTIAPGEVAAIAIGPAPRRVRWGLERVGGSKPLRRGRGSGPRLAVRIPTRARPGLYLVRIAAAGRRALVPVAVGGARRGVPLVVLPFLSWRGQDPADVDADGFSDGLATAGLAALAAPYRGGSPPRGLASQVRPLLRFLDRRRLPYDVTTDVALASTGGPPPWFARPGLAFPGSELWLTERLDLALRRYVERGGRIAAFGGDSFKRRVTLARGLLTAPSSREGVNVFGERTRVSAIPPAPLVVSRDRLRLFSDTDGLIGLFGGFEQSEGLVAGARLLAGAGRDPSHPSFVAYRLADGLVLRVGATAWSRALARDPEVAAVTKRAWALISR